MTSASFLTSSSDPVALTIRKLRERYTKCDLDGEVTQALDQLVANLRSGDDRKIIVVVGESGRGKTRTIRECLLAHTDLSAMYRSFDADSPCTLRALGTRILRELGHPVARANIRDHELIERIDAVLPHSGAHVIHIDEAQHALTTDGVHTLTRVRDFWKRLVQSAHPLGLILSGMPRVQQILEEDPQLARRAIFISAKAVTQNDVGDIRSLIKNYAAEAGLEVDLTDNLAGRLIHSCAGAYGQITSLLLNAIERTLRAGQPCLGRAHFATAYAMHAGAEPDANPFIQSNWDAIDVSRMIADTLVADQTLPTTVGERKRRSKK